MKLELAIEILKDGLVRINRAFDAHVVNGDVKPDSPHAVRNRKKAEQIRYAIDVLERETNNKYLILSGEGRSDTEYVFCMECDALDDANRYFDDFKRGTFAETNLFIYEAKKVREE